MHELYYNKIVKIIANNENLVELMNDALFNISYDLQNKLNENIITFHHSLSNEIHFMQYSRTVIMSICSYKYILSKDKIIKNYLKIASGKTSKKASIDIMIKSILKELLRQINIFT